MTQSIELIQTLRPNSFGESIFYELSELLSEPQYELAIRVMAWDKNIDRYHSLADFMFVEMFPLPWRWRCFNYYKNKRKPLDEYDEMSTDYTDWVDKFLCNCVRLAYDYIWHRYDISWKGFAMNCMFLFIDDRDKAKKLTLML